ncbi:DAK2 domain-containing protein [Micromonospora sp. NBC_01699]|uniref:DAK2 domain-containing protein n=1 Tax=Micromonospora sp. NBC_01699 TaxID=2975984 RepID=UPI002E2EC956|nr:DAK2 domain-containing protein [Micromonospora sp. NBC_01699]
MLETLDAAAVRRWCAGGLAALKRHQSEIDELNVYPVPDGDTGTNLVLTLTSAQQALALDLDNSAEQARTGPPGETAAGGQSPHGRVLRLMARGALLGARGNSGVIVSQILHGLADTLATTPAVRGRDLARALGAASAAAYAAVAVPVEGTVLTVVAAAADAAVRADTDELGAVARAAADGGADALARTPEQLPVLARAGVVDAGGRGLCVLLDALVEVITGAAPRRPSATVAAPAPAPPVTAVRETGAETYAYEVQFLLDAEPAAVRRLRTALAGLGDSLVVVGDEATPEQVTTWNVHVHVNDVGAAVEAGVSAGRPYHISVVRFADPEAGAGAREADRDVPAEGSPLDTGVPVAEPAPVEPTRPSGRSAVVMAHGAGLAELLAAEGATVVGGNPSTGELLAAIRSTGAAQVVVLPNDPNTQAVANAAAKEAHGHGVKVSVVPTRSPVQALAALAVRDPGRRFEDDVIAMAEAAGACRYGEVCHASREALTVAGRCQPGDVLALVEGEVHLIGTELVSTCAGLLDRMLGGGGELVTLLLGADAPTGLADSVRAHVSRRWPFVEVHDYPGGQPFYPLLVGIE